MKFANANATSQKLESIITAAVQDESANIPGISFVVVSKDGSTLFEHAAGTRGVTSPEEPITSETIFWIASCTKMVTALCCMQLVEQGKLSLDDSDQLEALVPELKDVRVLKEDGRTLEEKKKGITLRMLLTHTAGFGYTFFNEQLRDWSYPAGVDEFSGDVRDIKQPLVFQPGEGWEYGVSEFIQMDTSQLDIYHANTISCR
jgi:CubicO group peptidase (beta-lactamase class C family)